MNSGDGMDRLVLKTDQKGETVTFVFDLAGRLEKRQYRTLANSPSGTIADEDEFTWDEASRILTAVKGRYSNTVEFTYDDGGRIETEALTIDGQTYTVSLAFDDAGRIDEMTYPSGNMVNFDHNSRGLLSEIIRGTTTLASFGYDDGGRETSRTFGNSLATTTSYVAGHNLIAGIANSTVGNYSYGWDANHNKTSETITGAASNYGFTIPTAGYDDDNRLIGWERHDSGLDLAWDLSPVGNWNTYTVNTVAENRTHSDAHEIAAIDTTPLTHDPKGNLTEDDDGLTYTWDFDNMLASVIVPTGAPVGIEGTHEYAYDALGRRVAKTVQDGMTTTTSVFVHSDQRIVAQYPSGTAATSPDKEYVYGTYIDELIALIDRTDLGAVSAGSDELLYAHQSHQFHVIALTDSTGNVFERYAYTPYGEVTILDPAATSTRAASDIGNAVTYTGQRLDPETGLYHFRARMLHPRLGRFIGRDPLGYVDGASRYRAYFAHSTTDPLGLAEIDGESCSDEEAQCINAVIDDLTRILERPQDCFEPTDRQRRDNATAVEGEDFQVCLGQLTQCMLDTLQAMTVECGGTLHAGQAFGPCSQSKSDARRHRCEETCEGRAQYTDPSCNACAPWLMRDSGIRLGRGGGGAPLFRNRRMPCSRAQRAAIARSILHEAGHLCVGGHPARGGPHDIDRCGRPDAAGVALMFRQSCGGQLQ